jgi:hypothetical protein
MPIGVAEFVENQENRCPVVLLLDTSGSMQGEPIKALNDGIKTFQEDVMRDTQATLSVETAIVTFGNGGVKTGQDFVGIDQFTPPTLTAGDLTPMGKAIELALDLIADRQAIYKNYGIQYYRPWVFLITDGAPTDQKNKKGVLAPFFGLVSYFFGDNIIIMLRPSFFGACCTSATSSKSLAMRASNSSARLEC